MAILIKCNESDLVRSDEQTFLLPKEKGLGLTRGEEAFVWISESPREGRPESPGLRLLGEITNWEPSGGRTMVSIRVAARKQGGLGMNDLGTRASDGAQNLHRRLHRFRHRRIWGLSAAEREILVEAFHI